MDKTVLQELRIGHLARILITLYELEKQGYTPSLAELVKKAGVSESAFYTRVKQKMVRAGLVKEETLPYRVKTLRLTPEGRRLAECLLQCRDLIL